MVKISPSVLSANFACLAKEIAEVESAGADWLHIDVMDGHFVPNLTFGVPVIEAIRAHTMLPLDVHLMINKPERYIVNFIKAGANIITVHAEACPHLHYVIDMIKQAGCRAGVAINPATPVSVLNEVLQLIDLVLIMTVNPGFGGQAFIPTTIEKIRQARNQLIEKGCRDVHIQVDGGITAKTAPAVVSAGADVLVAGTAIFGSEHRETSIKQIRDAFAG